MSHFELFELIAAKNNEPSRLIFFQDDFGELFPKRSRTAGDKNIFAFDKGGRALALSSN